MERQLAINVAKREAGRVLQLADDDRLLVAPVPTCPGWELTDLLKHLGNFYNWVGTIIEGRLEARPGAEIPRRPEGVSSKDWLADRVDRIMSIEAGVPDDAVMWNFASESPGPVGFWLRRQVHETAIHRVDAELACSVPVSTLEPDIAADCVSEFFMLVQFEEVDAPAPPGFTVHLHATDLDEEWTIDTTNRTISRIHAKGDVAIRATAWALARWCWGRPVDGEIEVFGDLGAADSWRQSIAV